MPYLLTGLRIKNGRHDKTGKSITFVGTEPPGE
jgi:hypothetical protein